MALVREFLIGVVILCVFAGVALALFGVKDDNVSGWTQSVVFTKPSLVEPKR